MQSTMDNNNEVQNGTLSMLISIITATIAWIGTHDLSELIRGFAGLVAIISGIMAIRYYYYATIKARK